MDSSLYVFEIKDWKQRVVRLTHRTYDNHCTYRPETQTYLEAAQKVIQDPDIVLLNDKNATLLYRFGLGESPFANLYLEVVIFYDSGKSPEIGKVATFHFTDEIDNDATIVEQRAQFLSGHRFSFIPKGEANDSR